uniref:Uncharacterized protein n=1 Tax=Schistosoma japonicum TaxID=6182 RepID=Q5C4E5_SCHJA|nr:unknown [Schistosoma japonicum]
MSASLRNGGDSEERFGDLFTKCWLSSEFFVGLDLSSSISEQAIQ